MFARPEWINWPFYFAGALKILYDVALYRAFVNLRPPEGAPGPSAAGSSGR